MKRTQVLGAGTTCAIAIATMLLIPRGDAAAARRSATLAQGQLLAAGSGRQWQHVGPRRGTHRVGNEVVRRGRGLRGRARRHSAPRRHRAARHRRKAVAAATRISASPVTTRTRASANPVTTKTRTSDRTTPTNSGTTARTTTTTRGTTTTTTMRSWSSGSSSAVLSWQRHQPRTSRPTRRPPRPSLLRRRPRCLATHPSRPCRA